MQRMLFQFLPELIAPYDVRRVRLPVPAPAIDEPPYVYLCLNSSWASFIDGVIERLLFADVWDGTSEQVEWAIKEIERFLATMSCWDCGGSSTAMYRYTADGRLEKSTDGGETWEPADLEDPRFNSPVFPPLPGEAGDDMRCLAAANAQVGVKELIDKVIAEWAAGGSLAAITAVVVALLLTLSVFATAGASAPLWVAFVAALLQFPAPAIDAAMTPEVYDTFRCILYCNAKDDGSWTTEGWEQIKAEISQNFTGAAHEALWNEVNGLGPSGLTNLGRINRAGVADCSDCGQCEWCYEFDFTASNGGWIAPSVSDPNTGQVSVWVSGQGWVGYYHVPEGDDVFNVIDRNFDQANITRIEITSTGSGNCTPYGCFIRVSDHDSVLQNTTPAAGESTVVWTGDTNTSKLRILRYESGTSPSTITKVRIRGTGANPFGANNCPPGE